MTNMGKNLLDIKLLAGIIKIAVHRLIPNTQVIAELELICTYLIVLNEW